MKTVKVRVAVVMIVVLLVIVLVAYMTYQNNKVTEEVVANDKMRLENERLNLLDRFNISKQIEGFQMREPIGFKLT